MPPQGTIEYFDRVRGTIGPNKADQMLRLFMVPGVQHCLGGPGLNAFGQFSAPPQPPDPSTNLAAALEHWVEAGIAPDSFIATHSSNQIETEPRAATPENSELVCAYPKIAVSAQHGDFAAPGSFQCKMPATGPEAKWP